MVFGRRIKKTCYPRFKTQKISRAAKYPWAFGIIFGAFALGHLLGIRLGIWWAFVGIRGRFWGIRVFPKLLRFIFEHSQQGWKPKVMRSSLRPFRAFPVSSISRCQKTLKANLLGSFSNIPSLGTKSRRNRTFWAAFSSIPRLGSKVVEIRPLGAHFRAFLTWV